MKKDYSNLLINEDVEAYERERTGVSQDFLDEAFNSYVSGDSADFRSHFKNISEVAQFVSHVIERRGTDVREIQKMLNILA